LKFGFNQKIWPFSFEPLVNRWTIAIMDLFAPNA